MSVLESTQGPQDRGEARAFARTLLCMSGDQLRSRAAALSVPEDHLAWWNATVAVERRLRLLGLGRQADVAARAAAQAVIGTAARTGVSMDAGIAAVVRSARDAARALVAGARSLPEAASLLDGWAETLSIPSDEPLGRSDAA